MSISGKSIGLCYGVLLSWGCSATIDVQTKGSTLPAEERSEEVLGYDSQDKSTHGQDPKDMEQEKGGEGTEVSTGGGYVAKLLRDDCVDPDLSDLKKGVSIMLCDGSLANGTYEPPPVCRFDGEQDCVNTGEFYAADTSGITGRDLVSGVQLAGVKGTFTSSFRVCTSDGETSCLASGSFPAAAAAGLADKVLSSETVAGISGNVTLPSAGKVLSGTSYGVGGTGWVGALTLPAAANVRVVNGAYGEGGTGTTPALSDCSTDGGTNCVAVAGFKAADMGVATMGNIKRGVTIAGVTGAFPSAAHPLPRYQDSGATTTVSPDGGITTDLTNFVTDLTTDGSFEFWDKTGIRRTGSGDSDIVNANVKDAVKFENLSVTGTYVGESPDAWDVRAGVTIAGVTGKLLVNCRNAINSSIYNYDGNTDSIPTFGTTSGSALDWWDTIDDYNSGASTVPFDQPASWTNTYCGGVEASAGDSNVWKDVTSTTCDAAGDECRYQDKITGIEWSASHGSMNWKVAVDYCNDLTWDGKSDWRLPTQKELQNAHGHGIRGAIISNQNWIDNPTLYYWSSTTISDDRSKARYVGLGNGTTYPEIKNGSHEVVCVRP